MVQKETQNRLCTHERKKIFKKNLEKRCVNYLDTYQIFATPDPFEFGDLAKPEQVNEGNLVNIKIVENKAYS